MPSPTRKAKKHPAPKARTRRRKSPGRGAEVFQDLSQESALLLARSREFVYRHDTKGVFNYMSPSVEAVTGHTPEEWLVHYSTFMTDSPINAKVFMYTEETLRSGKESPPYLVELQHKDGRLILMEIIERPYFDFGRVAGIIGVARDVTERVHAEEALRRVNEALESRVRERSAAAEKAVADLQRSEEALRQAQKMEAVGRLAGGIAHDFNNRLVAITGYCHLLLQRLPTDSPMRDDVLEIRAAAEGAGRLVRQLLAFGRRQVLDPRPIDLNDIVSGMESMVRQLVGEDVELICDFAPGIGCVEADPAQMEQVVLNLAANARDAMPQGGRLTIRTAETAVSEDDSRTRDGARPGLHVVLEIADTGAGMDPETLSRLFEPFFTTKPTGRGTGLGLSTSYGIVRQSGGHILVASGVGRGTVFRIFLPRVPTPPESHAVRVGARADQRGTETVLLVEDEPSVLKLFRDVLRKKGYCVLTAGRAEEAISTAVRHEGPIHLLLTDVVLPGMRGPDLARRLVASRPGLRVLYVSGYSEEFTGRRDATSAGGMLLSKPFPPETLVRRVREVLDEA